VAARMEAVKRCKSWRVLSVARRPSGPPSPKYRGAREDEHPDPSPFDETQRGEREGKQDPHGVIPAIDLGHLGVLLMCVVRTPRTRM
jgi:hypothetical protein